MGNGISGQTEEKPTVLASFAAMEARGRLLAFARISEERFMNTVGMQGVIQQMKVLATQAGGTPAKAATATGTEGFGQAMRASLDRINDMQQSATSEAQAFQAGKPGVALYDVMIDTQEASLAFQMGVQVRNRLVNAYKEVMNMQV